MNATHRKLVAEILSDSDLDADTARILATVAERYADRDPVGIRAYGLTLPSLDLDATTELNIRLGRAHTAEEGLFVSRAARALVRGV